MTVKILKSEADRIPDFAMRVATHAHNMKNWRAHMARVKADEGSELPPLQRHQAYDPPVDDKTVAGAVNENDEADYQIVDDGPSQDQILRMKKNHLLGAVHQAEVAAIEAIVPAGKRRYLNLIENDIRAGDAKRALELLTRKVGLGAKVGLGRAKTPQELSVEVDKTRPPAHQKHLDEQQVRNSKISAISEQAAKAQHDIEDLTLDNIDAWQLPELKA